MTPSSGLLRDYTHAVRMHPRRQTLRYIKIIHFNNVLVMGVSLSLAPFEVPPQTIIRSVRLGQITKVSMA